MVKKREINKIIKRYRKIFEDSEPNVQELATGLYEELAYMKATLMECKLIVMEEGVVIEDTSGNGFTQKKEHPAQRQYNTIIGNYTRTVKAIKEIIPAGDPAEDAFEKMLKEDSDLA